MEVVLSRSAVQGDAERGPLVGTDVLDAEAGVTLAKATLDYLVEELRSLELPRDNERERERDVVKENRSKGDGQGWLCIGRSVHYNCLLLPPFHQMSDG